MRTPILALALLVSSPAFGQDNKPVALDLTSDGTALTITFDVHTPTQLQLNAADVDRFLNDVAAMRARMQPPIPQRDPAPGDAVHIADPGRWFVGPNKLGGISIMTLHPGFGWVEVDLDHDGASLLEQTVLRLQPTVPIKE